MHCEGSAVHSYSLNLFYEGGWGIEGRKGRAPRQQASISEELPCRSAPTSAWRMRLATWDTKYYYYYYYTPVQARLGLGASQVGTQMLL